MDGVEGVFNCDSFEVASRHLETQREVKVDLLDGRFGEHLLQYRWISDGAGGGVHLPVFWSVCPVGEMEDSFDTV
jgi:hypothetical protein